MKASPIYKKIPKRGAMILLLSVLQETSLSTLDIIDIMLVGHTWMTSQKRRTLDKRSAYRQKKFTAKFEKIKNRQHVYNTLNYLKKQGLVSKESIGNKKTKWSITEKGLKGFLAPNIIYLPNEKFKSQPEKNLTVVIYDIPEKDKELRSWLRESLIDMNFALLQKSVWLGKIKIPENFMKALTELSLIPNQVKIFSIAKEGSIYY